MPDNHQLGRTTAQDLPAQFAADGAAPARNQHPFAPQQSLDRGRVGLDGIPAQQILDLHIPQLGHADSAVQQFIHAWHSFSRNAGLFADIDHFPDYLAGRCRHGDDHLSDLVLPGQFRNSVAISQHLQAMNAHVMFVHVIIDEADGVQAQLGVVPHFLGDHRPGIAGPHEQHPFGRPAPPLAIQPGRGQSHAEAGPAYGQQGQQAIDQGNGTRQPTSGRRCLADVQ